MSQRPTGNRLEDLYFVLLQTTEVLEPFAAEFPEIDQHLAEARSLCNQLKIRLEVQKNAQADPAG